MNSSASIGEYIHALKAADVFGNQVVFHEVREACKAIYAQPDQPWPKDILYLLEAMGIEGLYSHQVRVIDQVRQGTHTIAATHTASGKSLTYFLPVIESVLTDNSAGALFIYPLKALAQDQLKTITQMGKHLPQMNLTADIYDGDTSAYRRKKIRDRPPHILMTNPEMIHLSMLPYHHRWSDMLSRLRFVVVDEVHTYRGLLGTHMAQVFRRFLRICRHYGSQPTFIFTSATVANPEQLAGQLTGLPVKAVHRTTSGSGRRHLVLMDPVDGPLAATVSLLKAALNRGLRTIVYTRSRKVAELLSLWAKQGSGHFSERISAYRAGFLPEERRTIEARMASGELLAVISTSALELGIDIGALDLCLLVGYPGSIVSTLQRGGRVGRSGQESAVVMVAGEDALDQYFVKQPRQLVDRKPESAVVNPHNPDIMGPHLVCAAAEMPLFLDDPILASSAARECLDGLINAGTLFLSADGRQCLSLLKMPHRQLTLRGTGRQFAIINKENRRRLGDIDGYRVYRETHPGAVYIHRGTTYTIASLEPETRLVHARVSPVNYHTRVRTHKDTQILEIVDHRNVYAAQMAFGRLRVTEQVTGYDRIHTRSGKILERIELDLPPMVFDTQGLWFAVPTDVTKRDENVQIHVTGGLHALEHALIGVFPLVVMADRNDLGGISTPFHPQVEQACIFVYDGIPGGAGFCAQAYREGQALIDAALAAIADCPCETGCPSCVHSPKCGSGNRPIDKNGALFLLDAIINAPACATDAPSVQPVVQIREAGHETPVPVSAFTDAKLRYGVLDIETQRSAQEVGGWHHAQRMRVSCVVLYDSQSDSYYEFVEGQIPMLMNRVRKLDMVIGFNIKRFDYRVLSAYTDADFSRIPTLDLLEKVKDQLGYRLSLDHLASMTLNVGKTADGLDALRWWKEGKMAKMLEYCRSDVAITRDLYRFGRDNGYLLFQNKASQIVRLPVKW
ncbi:MAG: DEAD/DEAH box helicase [Proteobacteria bacterium]|nr:MAG: DEAD/DEAH box helicase [Pseudomonadota bacterium]